MKVDAKSTRRAVSYCFVLFPGVPRGRSTNTSTCCYFVLLVTTCCYFLLRVTTFCYIRVITYFEKVGESWRKLEEVLRSWRKFEKVRNGRRKLEQVWRRFEKTEESLDSTTSTSTSNVDIGLIGSVGIVDSCDFGISVKSSESTVK